MNRRLQGPDDDDEARRTPNDEIDLRYRTYQVDDESEDEYAPPDNRVTDGWSTESKSESSWWLKAGIAIVSIVIALSLIAGLVGPFFGSSGSDDPRRIEYVPAQVVEVIDMRTITVDIDGEMATVRYIGVEPLPLNSPWYDVGQIANQQLVTGSEVLLEADDVDSDDFGRLLRYVYVDQNMVNGLLVRNGIALPSDEREGLNRHHANLIAWSEAARFESLGHWSGASPRFAAGAGVN